MPTPSLILVPARFKTGKLYTPLATTSGGTVLGASGDFNVTRATTATRVNASGYIESVASGVPRLDYFASGGVVGCPALLVEPSGQNLIKQSDAFNTAEYTLVRLNAFGSGSVVNTTATKDPFNGNNADYLQEDSTASNTHLINQFNAGQVSGTNLTFSIFVKAAERTRISLFNSGGGAGNASFDLTAGTATLVNGVSASIQNYGNGWYRCILTYTPNATGNFNVQVLLADASGNTTYNGTGNSGLYVFGAQVETGSVATSYIPTTTASATRNADVISLSGAVSGCIGQTEGTIYAEVDAVNWTNLGRIFVVSDGTTLNAISILFNTSKRFRLIIDNGGSSAQADISSSSLSNVVHKIAVAYANNDIAFFVDGVLVGTDTSATIPACSQIFLGKIGTSSSTNFMNDRIRSAALYTTRLTNAELAALTTL